MAASGLKLIEVAGTEASLAALSAIKQQVPGLIVGAGTVTNSVILEQEAGSDFIVTPAVSEHLLRELQACPVPVLPVSLIPERFYWQRNMVLTNCSLLVGWAGVSVSSVFGVSVGFLCQPAV